MSRVVIQIRNKPTFGSGRRDDMQWNRIVRYYDRKEER
jgi:hypothetical protein